MHSLGFWDLFSFLLRLNFFYRNASSWCLFVFSCVCACMCACVCVFVHILVRKWPSLRSLAFEYNNTDIGKFSGIDQATGVLILHPTFSASFLLSETSSQYCDNPMREIKSLKKSKLVLKSGVGKCSSKGYIIQPAKYSPEDKKNLITPALSS